MEVTGQHDDLAAFACERTQYPLNMRRDGHLGEEKISLEFISSNFFPETYA